MSSVILVIFIFILTLDYEVLKIEHIWKFQTSKGPVLYNTANTIQSLVYCIEIGFGLEFLSSGISLDSFYDNVLQNKCLNVLFGVIILLLSALY